MINYKIVVSIFLIIVLNSYTEILRPHKISAGPAIQGFYYSESIKTSDILELNDLDENTVVYGAPKSDEYGLLIGADFNYTRRLLPSSFKYYAGAALGVGSNNTYDGSTQAQMDYSDSSIFFEEIMTEKNNIFFNTEIGMSFIFTGRRIDLEPSLGLVFNLWNRELGEYEGEYYTWINARMSTKLTFLKTGKVRLGIIAGYSPMLIGYMNPYIRLSSINIEATPVVLANRYSAADFAADVEIQIIDFLALRIRPFFKMYGFGKSNTETMTIGDYYSSYTTEYMEPESRTYKFGVCLQAVLSPKYKKVISK